MKITQEILTNHNVNWEVRDGAVWAEQVYAFAPVAWVDTTGWTYDDLLVFLGY